MGEGRKTYVTMRTIFGLVLCLLTFRAFADALPKRLAIPPPGTARMAAPHLARAIWNVENNSSWLDMPSAPAQPEIRVSMLAGTFEASLLASSSSTSCSSRAPPCA